MWFIKYIFRYIYILEMKSLSLYKNMYILNIIIFVKCKGNLDFKWLMNRDNVINLFKELLFGYKKEWNINICYNIEKF